MRFDDRIKKMLEVRSNHKISISSDCVFLALDIQSKTKEHLSSNTLKRLLGFLEDERTPNPATLEIIARYLGFKEWKDVEKFGKSYSCKMPGTRRGDFICNYSLSPNDEIKLTYNPDRIVIIKYLGKDEFEVLESKNSSLQNGDILTIPTGFRNHWSLIVINIRRNGQDLGGYEAGLVGGIRFKLIKSDSTNNRTSGVK